MWFIPPTASNSSLKGGLFCHRRQGYDVFAWKMHGFGGGRYQALVVLDSKIFCHNHREAIELHVRRQ